MTSNKEILSKCALRVPASGTLKMKILSTELESKGKEIIHLEVGEPNFNTPKEIIEAATVAMNEGKTGYTSSKGIKPLLEKIASIHSNDTGVDIDPKTNVITTPGAKASLFNALVSLVNPGENIIVISPYWPSYEGIMQFIGAETKVIPPLGDDFGFPVEKVKESINDKTKAILINSPSNPTGSIYDLDTLKIINDISTDNNLMIITDEIYKKIVFEGISQQYLSISQSLDNTLVIDGLSKSHAMTGWRFGYAIGNKELISSMNKVQQNISTCVSTPTQWGALKALDLEEPTKKMVAEYKTRRDKSLELIEQCEYLSCKKPKGAFYLFMKYEGKISSDELAVKILEEKGVALTAGSVFGVKENYLRVSLASELVDILEGIKRTNDLISTLQ